MEKRQEIIPYVLEETARPGAREIRARKPPDGIEIRYLRRNPDEKRKGE